MDDGCSIVVHNKRQAITRTITVDCDDLARLDTHNWYLNIQKYSNGYSRSKPYELIKGMPKGCGKCPQVSIQKFLLNIPVGSPLKADHINGDTTDARKSNLRRVTNQENLQNMAPRPGFSSRFRGISWNRVVKKWEARITVWGKKMFLGYCDQEEECAELAAAARRQHMPYDVQGQQLATG